MDHGKERESFYAFQDLVFQGVRVLHRNLFGAEFLESIPHLHGEFHPVVQDGSHADVFPLDVVFIGQNHRLTRKNSRMRNCPESWKRLP